MRPYRLGVLALVVTTGLALIDAAPCPTSSGVSRCSSAYTSGAGSPTNGPQAAIPPQFPPLKKLRAFAALSPGSMVTCNITFDDIADQSEGYDPSWGRKISVYKGWTGSFAYWLNASWYDSYENPHFRESGYVVGRVSPPAVIYNANAAPAWLMPGYTFQLHSLYATAAWDSGITMHINLYKAGEAVFSSSTVITNTRPTLVTFPAVDVDKFEWISEGNQIALDSWVVSVPSDVAAGDDCMHVYVHQRECIYMCTKGNACTCAPMAMHILVHQRACMYMCTLGHAYT